MFLGLADHGYHRLGGNRTRQGRRGLRRAEGQAAQIRNGDGGKKLLTP